VLVLASKLDKTDETLRKLKIRGFIGAIEKRKTSTAANANGSDADVQCGAYDI